MQAGHHDDEPLQPCPRDDHGDGEQRNPLAALSEPRNCVSMYGSSIQYIARKARMVLDHEALYGLPL